MVLIVKVRPEEREGFDAPSKRSDSSWESHEDTDRHEDTDICPVPDFSLQLALSLTFVSSDQDELERSSSGNNEKQDSNLPRLFLRSTSHRTAGKNFHLYTGDCLIPMIH